MTNATQTQLPETVIALAANGHLMEYAVVGADHEGRPVLSQWNAGCADDCRACADGDTRPDW